MKEFSKAWKSSKNPGKQRKYRIKSPLHIKRKLLSAHLSKELRKRYGKRNIVLRKGDKVKVLSGQFKKYENKVEIINITKSRIFVNGIEVTKKDGSKKQVAIHPSNLMITELNLDDKLRMKILERK